MSVATKNPFALLDASPPPSPPPVDPPPLPPATQQNTNNNNRGSRGGGKYYQRGGAPKTTEDPAARNPDADGFRARGRGRTGGDRGGDRGGSRGEGRRGGRGRPFDRHSQTGKTDSDKKVHQSWGGDDGATELKVEQEATVDAAADVTTDWAASADTPAPGPNDWGTPDNAAAPADDPWAVPADSTPAPADGDKPADRDARKARDEEEDNTLTLDQYLAQKKENDLIPKLEHSRKPNEGADDSIWKDTVPLKKVVEEDAYFVGKSKSAPKPRTKKDEKVFLEIDARFDRPSRGTRGGRGGDRGGGDRPFRGARGGGRSAGAGKTGRLNGAPAVDVGDEIAFPSLS